MSEPVRDPMWEDPYVVVVLSLALLCALLLLLQHVVPAATRRFAADLEPPGRYEMVRTRRIGIARNPALLLDTATGRTWTMRDLRRDDAGPFAFETLPSLPLLAGESVSAEETRRTERELTRLAREGRARRTREWAAYYLSDEHLDSAQVLPVLAELLEDEDGRVVITAVAAMVRRGDPDALPALRSHLEHPDPIVAEAVAAAVAELEER